MSRKDEQDAGYQGWTNYETWAVGLWIDNERTSHEAVRDMAREAHANAPTAEQVKSGIWSDEQAERFNLADNLKAFVEDGMPDLGATLASDLLSAALSEVNWNELAESYLAEARETAQEGTR